MELAGRNRLKPRLNRTDTFEFIPDKVEMVQELYRRFADGETVWSIAKGFRERGIPTLRGKTFASGNIYRVVKSKAPFGILEVGRGTKNNRTITEQIVDYFPRIVDEEIQRRVSLRLDNMGKNAKPEAKGHTSPKRRTHGILTGVIWSPDKAGGNRAVCRKSVSGAPIPPI